jgi:Tol biopolymer transport system component
MKNKINTLLGAVVSLLVIAGFTDNAAAQGDIVFYAPVIATNMSKRGAISYTTNNQVMTMNADGSGLRQLTFGPQDSYHPTWRPGRTHILFFRKNSTSSDLYCMNSDGSGAFVVAASAGGAGADWSPDGTMVCYPGRDASGHWGLLVVSVDPSARRNKVGTPGLVWNGDNAYGPSWSHHGDKIAFSSGFAGGTPGAAYITVLDLTTGAANTLDLAHSLLPSWSPTDDTLAFVSGAGTTNHWQLFIMNPDLSGLTQVTDYNTSVVWPSWAPDGTQMAFRIGTGQNGDASIYKLTLATGELTLLRNKADHADWNP